MICKKALVTASLSIILFLSSCIQQGSSYFTPEEAFNTVKAFCSTINERLSSLGYPCIDTSFLEFQNEQMNILHTIEIDDLHSLDIEFSSSAYTDETGTRHNGELYFYVHYYLESTEKTSFDTVLFSELSNCVSSAELTPDICDIFLGTDDLSDIRCDDTDGIKVSKVHYLNGSYTSALIYTELVTGETVLTYKYKM